jgi:signal transduction histidine kinase
MTRSFAFSWRLFLAFAAVVLSFTAAAAYVNARAVGIDTETDALIENALPSIEALSAAANAVHTIETATDDYADVPEERAAARETIERLWREVDQELATYLDLPSYPGERERYQASLPGALRVLYAAIRRLDAVVETGHTGDVKEKAIHDVRRAAVLAGDELVGLAKFNREHAHAHVRHIEDVRRQTSQVALTLNAVAVVIGALVLLWLLVVFRAGARLEQAHTALVEQRAAELELFGTRVAHDLLSPLSALTFCLGNFKRPAENDPTLQEALVRARSCVSRAQRMVESIFEFARAGGKPAQGARADVLEVAAQVAAEIRTADVRDRPEIEIEPFPSCAVACSAGVLSSLLANLMGNAAKYLSDSSVRKITVRVAEAGGAVRVEVEDTGPGVPAGLEEAIFEPYVRAAGATQAGIGLGLATVRRLCVAHGGAAGVRSSPGRGSVFWITLPPAAPAAVDEPPVSQRLLRRVS